MTRIGNLILGASLALLHPVAGQAAEDSFVCGPVPEPVISLNHGSRYTDESVSRSDLDEESNAEVNAALGPIDDFIRDMMPIANDVTRGDDAQRAKADCIVSQLAVWAEADALSELSTITANFSVGARLAGFALAYRQVAPYATNPRDRATIEDWLSERINEQMLFWEEDATQGAKRGNLRAWATLAVNLVADITDDPVALRWSAWSAAFLQCQAAPDGSLPQEMRRGKYALHYQLHAIGPLVLTTLLLEQQGMSIKGVCDNALDRIVAFAIDDIANDGAASAAYSGKEQSLFDGTNELDGFEVAWLEAYLLLNATPEAEALAADFRPLNNSKLGGNQALLWSVAP